MKSFVIEYDYKDTDEYRTYHTQCESIEEATELARSFLDIEDVCYVTLYEKIAEFDA